MNIIDEMLHDMSSEDKAKFKALCSILNTLSDEDRDNAIDVIRNNDGIREILIFSESLSEYWEQINSVPGIHSLLVEEKGLLPNEDHAVYLLILQLIKDISNEYRGDDFYKVGIMAIKEVYLKQGITKRLEQEIVDSFTDMKKSIEFYLDFLARKSDERIATNLKTIYRFIIFYLKIQDRINNLF